METTGLADSKLADALRQYATDRFSGDLQVDGQPGGTIHLTDGRISACETSGAPSLEVILLRSQRVSETDWDAAFTAAAANERQMTTELVDRGLLGAGEVEALLRIALADAVFAIVTGQVDGWTEAPPADCLLPLTPAARSGWLLAEAARRGQVLASFPEPLVSAQDRVAAVPGSVRAGHVISQGRDEILALADGRRTARDLAFALGRGLYETMLQLARMRDDDFVVLGSSGGALVGQEDDRTVTGLPRRRKDRPGAPQAGEAGRRNRTTIRMLRPRAEGNTMPEGTGDGGPVSTREKLGHDSQGRERKWSRMPCSQRCVRSRRR